MVFISHRIYELKAICDTLTVLRDGKLIETGPIWISAGEAIAEKMLGHELSYDIYPPARPCAYDDAAAGGGAARRRVAERYLLHLRKAKSLALPVWRAQAKPNSARRCLVPAKAGWSVASLIISPETARDPGRFCAAGAGALVPEEWRKEGFSSTSR